MYSGSRINTELQSAANLVGFDKVLFSLLKGLAKQSVPSINHRTNINNLNSIESDEVQSLILAILTCQNMPTHVLEEIAKLVLEQVLSLDWPQTEMRPFLSALHQRHPAILNSVSEKMIQDDDSAQSSMTQLHVSLFLASNYVVMTYCIV